MPCLVRRQYWKDTKPNYDSHRYLFTLSPWKTYVFPSAVLKIVSTEGSEHKFLSLLVSAGNSLIKASSASSQSTCRCHSNVARLLSIQRLDGPHVFAVKDQRAADIERLHKWRHDRVPDVGMSETQRMPNLVDKSLKERKQLKFQCNASKTWNRLVPLEPTVQVSSSSMWMSPPGDDQDDDDDQDVSTVLRRKGMGDGATNSIKRVAIPVLQPSDSF